MHIFSIFHTLNVWLCSKILFFFFSVFILLSCNFSSWTFPSNQHLLHISFGTNRHVAFWWFWWVAICSLSYPFLGLQPQIRKYCCMLHSTVHVKAETANSIHLTVGWILIRPTWLDFFLLLKSCIQVFKNYRLQNMVDIKELFPGTCDMNLYLLKKKIFYFLFLLISRKKSLHSSTERNINKIFDVW